MTFPIIPVLLPWLECLEFGWCTLLPRTPARGSGVGQTQSLSEPSYTLPFLGVFPLSSFSCLKLMPSDHALCFGCFARSVADLQSLRSSPLVLAAGKQSGSSSGAHTHPGAAGCWFVWSCLEMTFSRKRKRTVGGHEWRSRSSCPPAPPGAVR